MSQTHLNPKWILMCRSSKINCNADGWYFFWNESWTNVLIYYLFQKLGCILENKLDLHGFYFLQKLASTTYKAIPLSKLLRFGVMRFILFSSRSQASVSAGLKYSWRTCRLSGRSLSSRTRPWMPDVKIRENLRIAFGLSSYNICFIIKWNRSVTHSSSVKDFKLLIREPIRGEF